MNKLFKNPIGTISNAVEINTLKERRERLRNEKHEVDNKIRRYSEQLELVKSCEKLTSTQKECLIQLRTIFAQNNIQYQISREEYESEYNDSQLLHYKDLYDKLILMETTMKPCISAFTNTVDVNVDIYKQNSDHLERRIEEINQRLSKVREKQFG